MSVRHGAPKRTSQWIFMPHSSGEIQLKPLAFTLRAADPPGAGIAKPPVARSSQAAIRRIEMRELGSATTGHELDRI